MTFSILKTRHEILSCAQLVLGQNGFYFQTWLCIVGQRDVCNSTLTVCARAQCSFRKTAEISSDFSPQVLVAGNVLTGRFFSSWEKVSPKEDKTTAQSAVHDGLEMTHMVPAHEQTVGNRMDFTEKEVGENENLEEAVATEQEQRAEYRAALAGKALITVTEVSLRPIMQVNSFFSFFPEIFFFFFCDLVVSFHPHRFHFFLRTDWETWSRLQLDTADHRRLLLSSSGPWIYPCFPFAQLLSDMMFSSSFRQVQLVLTYQRVMDSTGNMDLCYYNFKCAHPWGKLEQYRTVVSSRVHFKTHQYRKSYPVQNGPKAKNKKKRSWKVDVENNIEWIVQCGLKEYSKNDGENDEWILNTVPSRLQGSILRPTSTENSTRSETIQNGSEFVFRAIYPSIDQNDHSKPFSNRKIRKKMKNVWNIVWTVLIHDPPSDKSVLNAFLDDFSTNKKDFRIESFEYEEQQAFEIYWFYKTHPP